MIYKAPKSQKESGCVHFETISHRWQRSMLGISWKDRITNIDVITRTGQETMDNIQRERRLRWLGHVREKDDYVGLDMFCVWTISAYPSKHCTCRYQDIREDQVDQELTGGAQSTKTYKRLGSPRKKQRWQLLTDTDSVGVWLNVSSWMRNEPSSKVKP